MMAEILKLIPIGICAGFVYYLIDSKLHKETWRKGYTRGYLDGQLETLAKMKIINPNSIKETTKEKQDENK